MEQEKRLQILKKFENMLKMAKLANVTVDILWFEDKIQKQKNVIKKHQREYNLSLLLDEKDSL
jgi:hypothetical protein